MSARHVREPVGRPRRIVAGLIAAALLLPSGAPRGEAKEATIGYQLIYAPWAVPIAQGRVEKDTGYDVRWVKLDSGARVAAALAAGDIDIGVLGSGALTAGIAGGTDLLLLYVMSDVAAAEALVARDGAGIDPAAPATLRGKRVATPFLSTSHYHLLAALRAWGIPPSELRLVDLPPQRIEAAWARGDIDAAFVRTPVLTRIARTGTTMIVSAELAAKGRPTFHGMAARRAFAEANRDFLVALVRIVAEAGTAYRGGKERWIADSPEIAALVSIFGGDPDEVPPALALYAYPTLEEQASERWLGGGARSGAAQALHATAELFAAHGLIGRMPQDLGRFVTNDHVLAALRLGN